MKKISSFITSIALILSIAAGSAVAQQPGIGTPPSADMQAYLLAAARAKLKEGEESFARADFDHARTSFDAALDVFLTAGYDLRSDPNLMAAYRETLEKVHRYQILGGNAEGETIWPLQAYEATSEDFRPEDVPTESDIIAATGDMINASFLIRLGELQRRFKDRFGRDFTLTGRDTGVHTRLYGHGRATDIRVRDLNTAQVSFIVQHARELNMRVLDFSTSDRVYQHNARVMSLGRPADTLATGVHLHLNDQPRAVSRYAAREAAKTKIKAKAKE